MEGSASLCNKIRRMSDLMDIGRNARSVLSVDTRRSTAYTFKGLVWAEAGYLQALLRASRSKRQMLAASSSATRDVLECYTLLTAGSSPSLFAVCVWQRTKKASGTESAIAPRRKNTFCQPKSSRIHFACMPASSVGGFLEAFLIGV
jgi:hypothetical protein